MKRTRSGMAYSNIIKLLMEDIDYAVELPPDKTRIRPKKKISSKMRRLSMKQSNAPVPGRCY